MTLAEQTLKEFEAHMDLQTAAALDRAVDALVSTKERGGKVVVACGSGPNLHEGVTTLIAHLMDKGIIDGVTTSSAVIGHEMAGCLDEVKMCNSRELGFADEDMPRGEVFEFTCLRDDQLETLRRYMPLDEDLLYRGTQVGGHKVIKAAGNMAYPMGLWNETLATEIGAVARHYGLPFERVAGWGADRRTMIGIGAEKDLPVLVSIPQMVGGGAIGLEIGDSISIANRSARLAAMLEGADVIIESAIALSQELHDGPFEKYTGHGIWSWWRGLHTFHMRGKKLIRLDLDENLRRACEAQEAMQKAIEQGLPKTKVSGIPFRMEMSAFARHEGSIPLIGDIGELWPLMAIKTASRLGVTLDWMSYKQETAEGKAMRRWLVDEIKPIDLDKLRARAREVRL